MKVAASARRWKVRHLDHALAGAATDWRVTFAAERSLNIVYIMSDELADSAHEPAKPGTYTDRTRHERDRWAKWGTAKDKPAPKPKGKKKMGGKTNKIPAENLIPVADCRPGCQPGFGACG